MFLLSTTPSPWVLFLIFSLFLASHISHHHSHFLSSLVCFYFCLIPLSCSPVPESSYTKSSFAPPLSRPSHCHHVLSVILIYPASPRHPEALRLPRLAAADIVHLADVTLTLQLSPAFRGRTSVVCREWQAVINQPISATECITSSKNLDNRNLLCCPIELIVKLFV